MGLLFRPTQVRDQKIAIFVEIMIHFIFIGMGNVYPYPPPQSCSLPGSGAPAFPNPGGYNMASLQVNVGTLKYIQDKVEFWFSEENLVDDEFLNSLMDQEKFVLISEIAKFHSVSSTLFFVIV